MNGACRKSALKIGAVEVLWHNVFFFSSSDCWAPMTHARTATGLLSCITPSRPGLAGLERHVFKRHDG
jgi:hypothetical protein